MTLLKRIDALWARRCLFSPLFFNLSNQCCHILQIPPFNLKIPSTFRYILTSLEFNCTQANCQVAWLSCGGVATEAATRKVPFRVDARGGEQGGPWLPCCLWPVACAVLQPVIRFVMACHYHESPVRVGRGRCCCCCCCGCCRQKEQGEGAQQDCCGTGCDSLGLDLKFKRCQRKGRKTTNQN